MALTPMQVEQRLLELAAELDDATKELVTAEHDYHAAKAHYEIAQARTRLGLGGIVDGARMTVQEKEDRALMETQSERMFLAEAEAGVRAQRAILDRVKTQIDITRSIGTSVRHSMEIA